MMMIKIKKCIIYLAFLSSMLSAGCMVYIVLWLEALRKGWLV